MKFKLITTLLACTALATTAHAAQPKKKLNADDRAKIAAMKKIVDSGLLFEDGIAKFATPDFAKAINGNIPGDNDDGYGWTCSYAGSYSGADFADDIFIGAKYDVLTNGNVRITTKDKTINLNQYKFAKSKNHYYLDDIFKIKTNGKLYSQKNDLRNSSKQKCTFS